MNTQKQEQKYHYSNSYFIPSPYFFSSLFVVSLHNWDYSFKKNFVYTEIRCSRNFRFSSSPPPPSNEILQNISLIAVLFFFCSGSLNRIVHAHRLCFDFAFLWTVSFLFVFFLFSFLSIEFQRVKNLLENLSTFHTIKKKIYRTAISSIWEFLFARSRSKINFLLHDETFQRIIYQIIFRQRFAHTF